jgi:hypothetical protein
MSNSIRVFLLLFLVGIHPHWIRAQQTEHAEEMDLATLRCAWAVKDPFGIGRINRDEWGSILGERLNLAHIRVSAQNNSDTLFLLIEVPEDSSDDIGADSLGLYIDSDGSGIISSRDVAYRFTAGVSNPTILFGSKDTYARVVSTFDGSPDVRQGHRFWGVAIPLAEIDSIPGQFVRVGFRVSSKVPGFDTWEPSGFPDFAPILIQGSNYQTVKYPTLLTLILSNKGSVLHSVDTTEKRYLLPDGSVRIRYADGTVITQARPGQGGGAESQYPTPPQLPPGVTPDYWLNYHANELAEIIQRLSGNDARTVSSLLSAERGFNIWKKIAFRSRIIFKMTLQKP